MINLEKVTIFHRMWDADEGVNEYSPKTYDGHWYEHIVTVTESSGTRHERQIKLRIPQQDVQVALGDKVVLGKHTMLPREYGTVTVVSHNKKGANPHWLVMAN